jgi:zinc/manganese transport system substrate-binding protein
MVCVIGSVAHAQVGDDEHEPLKVVASFSILGDWVKVLGGDQVNVVNLVKADEDVHVYNATPKDMGALAKADILVVNGLGLEGWMERLVHSSGFSGSILTASYGVELITLSIDDDHSFYSSDSHQHDHDHGHSHAAHDDEHADDAFKSADPHAWTSLKQARVYVKNITAMLVRERADYESIFEKREAGYLRELDALDQSASQRLMAIPENQRNIVIPHNSFAYMARDYHLSIHSLSGLNTEAETSASNLAKVVRSVREKHIKVIFSENVSNTRMIEQIQNETGVKVYGRLLSGALSKEIAPDYLSMMRYNLDLLTQALSN